MAAIPWTDHTGKNFPSFAAMCRAWEKKPSTVKRRLNDSFYPWPLEMALEIPELPEYRFSLVSAFPNGILNFRVKIAPNNKQHPLYNDTVMTFAEIKKTFPPYMRQFQKGRMLGIY